jgi:hypothetical protein
VPTVDVGTDELFTSLGTATAPALSLTTQIMTCDGRTTRSTSAVGCDSGLSTALDASFNSGPFGSADMGAMSGTEVVVQSSVGPYDYAVLKADDQTAMLAWLDANRYVVPTGTDAAVSPYIHPGAYFLALKLKAGQSTGDITPIVLRYQSDLPMIPLTLTQVSATANMGVQVWVLGEARAVPRNFRHLVLSGPALWESAQTANGYTQLVTRAVATVPDHHAFVTDYSGSSALFDLTAAGQRFGDVTALAQLTVPDDFVDYLISHNYPMTESALVAVLSRYLPIPQALTGVSPTQYYQYFDSYDWARDAADGGAAATFDAAACAAELDQRVVTPTRQAQALFNAHPKLTRLYTVLSPGDMNADPVFEWNADLPDVSNVHGATLYQPCSGPSWMVDDQGFTMPPNISLSSLALPPVFHQEVLRATGPAVVEIDYSDATRAAIGSVPQGSSTPPQPVGGCAGGCAITSDAPVGPALLGGVLLLAALIARRRRQP